MQRKTCSALPQFSLVNDTYYFRPKNVVGLNVVGFAFKSENVVDIKCKRKIAYTLKTLKSARARMKLLPVLQL